MNPDLPNPTFVLVQGETWLEFLWRVVDFISDNFVFILDAALKMSF